MPIPPSFDSPPRGIFEAVLLLDSLVFIPTDPHVPAIPGNPVFPTGAASLVIDAVFDVSPGAALAATDDWSL